jgi:hypothetical protein
VTATIPKRAAGTKRGRGAPRPTGKQVSYSGRIFASGLEARWAILLDLLGLNWDYEPCHYQLSPKLWYLPDFYLPELQIWLEVKGKPFFARSDALQKAVYGVAGKEPIPQREYPYGASKIILFGGEIAVVPDNKVPAHTMVAYNGPGKAITRRVKFTKTEDGLILTPVSGKLLDFDAGTVKSSDATEDIADHLLAVHRVDGDTPEFIKTAYRAAARVQFTPHGRLDATRIHEEAMLLVRRRAGRPLPKSSWPKNLNRL